MRLQDKVIIVTGSTTGIGKAIAKRCVREGAKVIIHGLEKDLAAETLAQIGAANGVVHIEDLMSPGCPQRLVDLAVKTYGKLDGVVNNAAIVAATTPTTAPSVSHPMPSAARCCPNVCAIEIIELNADWIAGQMICTALITVAIKNDAPTTIPAKMVAPFVSNQVLICSITPNTVV